MNYDVCSDDVLRFADKMGLKEFDILGHSIGGRIALTTAQKAHERVQGVISIDSAPVDERQTEHELIDFFKSTLTKMKEMEEAGMTRKEAVAELKGFFKTKPEFVVLLMTLMNRKRPELEWVVNAPQFVANFWKLPYFDESTQYPSDKCYHIRGGECHINSLEEYQRAFPKQKEENIITLPGTGHWLHQEKPDEVRGHIIRFLDEMDGDRE